MDISDPNLEEEKTFMNDAADVEEEPVLPPQIFNDEEYVGVSESEPVISKSVGVSESGPVGVSKSGAVRVGKSGPVGVSK